VKPTRAKKAPAKKAPAKRAPTPGPTSAAIFDLDRTLLSGASGPIISEALRDVGLLSSRRNPAEPLLFGLFNLIGENRPTMMVTRQMARLAKGWPVATVRAAAKAAAPVLVDRLLPFAGPLIDQHRAEGRRLVLATTTPIEFIRPFAEAIGFDDVIATTFGVTDGAFDGSIDGEFVWGRGKARAVRAWADGAGIDLAASYAYSDSYFDVPLLSSVGSPHAVNPDPRLVGIAALRRWPILWLDVPPGVAKFAGIELQQAILTLARPELVPWARFRIYGDKRVPAVGPAIIVGNHRSYFDPFAIGMMLAKRGRPVRFLGKKEVFDAPVLGDLAKIAGGIRVDRGTGSDEPLAAAEEALRCGEMVAVMPEGTIPRGAEFFNPVLKGRWGAARLAHATRAPVIPVGLWGTERVWPRSSKVPFLQNIMNPPTVTIRVGPPVELGYEDLAEDTERIMSAIAKLLPPSARRPFEPTPQELAATYPSGKIPAARDAEHEAGRRPGTD